MDAGTKATEHYASRMGRSRFLCRSAILKVVRLETPILAKIQNTVRTPLLDWYFAVSANIGTHTFYLVMLPVTYWYGDPSVGEDLIWVLALGVFLTGFLKDLLCLPRPMSPPLHRISMSGSAMLEYGMPSTHSCNAISVAMVFLEAYPSSSELFWTIAWLLITLIAGRIYNGMHGFLDIIVGCMFGFLSYEVRRIIKARFDPLVFSDNLWITLFTIVAISACPSPVDDCPCFDDSVAFSGVVLGLLWTLYVGSSPFAFFDPHKFNNHWAVVAAATARFVIGVGVIVVWRHFSKRALLRILPPIWRKLEQLGIQNPRRYFVPATQYSRVPSDLPTDSIPDSKVEVAEMVTKFRRFHRSPSVSVGPQSEADLYELRAQHKDNPKVDDKNIEELRKRYDIEVVMRLIVYGGISPMALLVSPVFFKLLGL